MTWASKLAFAVLGLWLALVHDARASEPAHVAVTAALERPAKPGEIDWVAITFAVDPHWHIYWRNPGDTGLPTDIGWTLPEGVAAGAIAWPAPHRFVSNGIVNFGYSGTTTLLVPLRIRAHVEKAIARAHVSWLACAEMCVPGEAELDIPLDARASNGAIFSAAFAEMPKMLRAPVATIVGKHAIDLDVPMSGIKGIDPAAVMFFPYSTGLIEYDVLPTARVDGIILRLHLLRAGLQKGPVTISGILDLGGGRTFILSAAGRATPTPPTRPNQNDANLMMAMWLAFVGGLVLNVMPCVLPILSMKALALAQANGAGALRREGIAYFAGVLVTFLGIAGALVALKAAGAAVGWGFQLQSPFVVFGLFLLTGAIGLNLLGAYEVPLAFAGFGNDLARGSTGWAAFFTGALAVIVASPCTAPFMGAALGYALTQTTTGTFAVFGALGAGFAAPFTALTFAPGIGRLIPKPGAWMAHFRELLAFPVLATALWLLWVLDVQLGSKGLSVALALALGFVFLAWLMRHGHRRVRVAFLTTGMGLFVFGAFALEPAVQGDNYKIDWHPWSAASVDEARREGKPVLVDFTADWCITCLVNERIAFGDRSVIAGLRHARVAAFRGDWTNRNRAISMELERYRRTGVPLYLFYPPGEDGGPIVLPQVLTPGLVLRGLQEVAEKPR